MPSGGPRYPELDVHYVSQVSASDVATLLDELSHDFWGIRIYKENWRPAAGGLGNPESAIQIAIVVVAGGFLKELGADVYRKTRALLWERYTAWRNRKESVFLYHPLSVVYGSAAAGFYFVFEAGLSREDFDKALASISQSLAATEFPESNPSPWWYEFAFDSETGTWRLVYQEVAGEIRMDERNYKPFAIADG